jgi:5'-methylthioadenosine phosphorylase
VERVMNEKLELARRVLLNVVPRMPRDVHVKCEEVLKNACV